MTAFTHAGGAEGADQQDRNDARGIAQMIRVGLYRPVHVKTLRLYIWRGPDGTVSSCVPASMPAQTSAKPLPKLMLT